MQVNITEVEVGSLTGNKTAIGTLTVDGDVRPLRWSVTEGDTSEIGVLVAEAIAPENSVPETEVVETAYQPTDEDVNRECTRRILLIATEPKQRTHLAVVTNLVNKKVDGNTLTTEEETTLATLQAMWGQIQALIDVSNDLTDPGNAPIPVDYKDDSYWT